MKAEEEGTRKCNVVQTTEQADKRGKSWDYICTLYYIFIIFRIIFIT